MRVRVSDAPYELLDSDVYHQSPSTLSLALGRTTGGNPLVVDLGTLPHLLIAGAEDSDLQCVFNAMLVSILLRATAHDVQSDVFIMVFLILTFSPSHLLTFSPSPQSSVSASSCGGGLRGLRGRNWISCSRASRRSVPPDQS